MTVNDSLLSWNQTIEPIRLLPTDEDGKQAGLGEVVLVDSPGLEDNNASQHDGVVEAIRDWLFEYYPSPPPRRGIIFVQDISVCPLISPASFQNIQAVIRLATSIQCGDILLVPMKWGKMTQAQSERAEGELIQRPWKRMIDAGVQCRRIELNEETRSAIAIVQHFLQLTDIRRKDSLKALQTRLSVSAQTVTHPYTSKLALLPGCGRNDDVVILVLTHCGGTASMKVSEDLTLCTHTVDSAVIKSHSFTEVEARRIVLVDTPGFEADNLENFEVLNMINAWIRETYASRTAACSIIYLHDIAQDSYSRTAPRVLELFPSVVRNVSLKKGFLVSTKWDRSIKAACISRETELLTRTWTNLIHNGYAVRRLSDDSAIHKDPILQDGRETDIVIPIMGQTKAGKSSFVNQLLGWDRMAVGENLDSCTKHIGAALVDDAPEEYVALRKALKGRRIVLLDTPGFDDTDLGDDEVLLRIVAWLEATYIRKMLVGGVLYLHDITRDGWTGTSRRNLNLFHKLCGNDGLTQVSFLTTKWDDVTQARLDKILRRTTELKDNQWKDMIAGGASVYHVRPSRSNVVGTEEHSGLPLEDVRDPWEIIHSVVVSMNARDVSHRILLIQDELVNKHLFFIESKAGQALRTTLQDLLNRAKEVQKQAASEEDKASLEELQNEIDDLTRRLTKLNPALHKRLRRWFEDVTIERQVPVILVLGMSNSGKSTLINWMLDSAELPRLLDTELKWVAVRDSSLSKTDDMEEVHISYKTSKGAVLDVVLVDTPGFDHSTLSNKDVLKRLAQWLNNRSSEGIGRRGVTAVLYCHDISSNFASPTMRLDLEVLTKLCGPRAMNLVTFVTMKWDQLSRTGLGEAREEEMKRQFWSRVVPSGSCSVKQVRVKGDAQKLLEDIAYRLAEGMGPLSLQMQEELASAGGLWSDTEAGRCLEPSRKQARNNHDRAFNSLAESLRGALRMHWHTTRTENLGKAGGEMGRRKDIDPVLMGGKEGDLIILVVGEVQSGKSTFIKRITGDADVEVATKLKACTKHVRGSVWMQGQPEVLLPRDEHGVRPIIFVDTPGFDRANNKWESLYLIAHWLEEACKRDKRIGGVLYMHDITRSEFTSSSKQNLRIISKLCGVDAMNKVALVTTKWDRISLDEGENRARELKELCREELLQYGASIYHVGAVDKATNQAHNTAEHKEALEILHEVIAKGGKHTLQIQDEMVREGRNLSETSAGREVPRLPKRNASRRRRGIWARKTEDAVLSGGLDTDIVIPVMGPTKAGKSSFLNHLIEGLSLPGFPVGTKLVSCTQAIDSRILREAPSEYAALNRELDGRRIILVDTPGFDDTYIDDQVILSRIADWLRDSYQRRMLVGGVLYLHDISRDGFPESCLKNLKLFAKLCGDSAMHQVTFVTTKWDRLRDTDEGLDRVVELRNDFWREMTDNGANVSHLQPPDVEHWLSRQHKRPWDIIYGIVLSAKARDVCHRILQIQDEVVNRRRFLAETDAGRELRRSLESMLETAKYLRRQDKEGAKGGDSSAEASLKARQDEISALTQQLKKLELPGMQTRAKRWLQLRL
ncbi:hypothetical protein NMY22_g2655 [Coprinellus aureogranulatus]|nr:hypothetical protein NMY22_g2655 [Coprinellus aureogranulatus]